MATPETQADALDTVRVQFNREDGRSRNELGTLGGTEFDAVTGDVDSPEALRKLAGNGKNVEVDLTTVRGDKHQQMQTMFERLQREGNQMTLVNATAEEAASFVELTKRGVKVVLQKDTASTLRKESAAAVEAQAA